MVEKAPHPLRELMIALSPVVLLIALLSYNVGEVFGDDALSGSNQLVLMLAGAFTVGLGMWRGVKFETFIEAFSRNIGDTTKALIILLLIGALTGTWMISGIVPAMVYYGLQVLNAKFFLAASVIICALVSVSTGSSWSTSATVGIALIAMAKMLGISEGMAAGAIISGAYFGDKMSPMSDTTNLAPAMAGTDLFTHIRYMALTTVPSILIAFIIFLLLGLLGDTANQTINIQHLITEIDKTFHISPLLFLVPALVIFLIFKKIDALVAILAGAILGGVFAIIFQPEIVQSLAQNSSNSFSMTYEGVVRAMIGSVNIPANDPLMAELLSSGGMYGMLPTVWLIISAMIFGGAMEAAGFLKILTTAIARLAQSTASLIGSTLGTSVLLNITASDQYLAIVVPGRMFKELYAQRDLAPENLSRSLEDAGTATSVLIPWNTCGAYHSGVLGVATMAYLPFAFFNLLSPLMSLLFAVFKIRIKKL